MTVLITLTLAGTDTGPFDLYSDVDGFVSAFETGVSKVALQAGYLSALVPNGTTVIRVKSTGVCTNYIDINVVTTTTTTTSTSSTTTTTTTTLCPCVEGYSVEVTLAGDINYLLCDGTPQTNTYPLGPNVVGSGECIQRDSLVSAGATFTLDTPGACCSTTTTTTTVAPPVCNEYYNGTAGDLNGINYTACDGTPFIGQTVGIGQSICAQDGTVTGADAAFLTVLGGCT